MFIAVIIFYFSCVYVCQENILSCAFVIELNFMNEISVSKVDFIPKSKTLCGISVKYVSKITGIVCFSMLQNTKHLKY